MDRHIYTALNEEKINTFPLSKFFDEEKINPVRQFFKSNFYKKVQKARYVYDEDNPEFLDNLVLFPKQKTENKEIL